MSRNTLAWTIEGKHPIISLRDPTPISFTNHWRPPPSASPIDLDHILSLPPQEYDLNFCFPEAVNCFENDCVKLVPYVPSLHAVALFEAFRPHPEMFQFWPVGPYESLEDFVRIFEMYRAMQHTLVYVVYDRLSRQTPDEDVSTAPVLAGTIGLLNGDPSRASVEIGHLMILPRFRGTHVTRNAIGLLALLCFSEKGDVGDGEENIGRLEDSEATKGLLPRLTSGATEPESARITVHRSLTSGTENSSYTRLKLPDIRGLALRRVQYQLDPQNVASRRAGERLGFRFEGVFRWVRVVAAGNRGVVRGGGEAKGVEGNSTDGGDAVPDSTEDLPGWHSMVLAMYWDEWDAREILRVMAHRSRLSQQAS